MDGLPRRDISVAWVALVLGCTTARPAADATPPERHFRNGVLVSTSLPPLRLAPGPGLQYLGVHPFRIRDVAAGERHVFADLDGSRIRRLLLLQFEGYLDGVSGNYDYRTTNPVQLGGETYNQNVYLFDAGADSAPEGLATRTFVRERGLEWPREQMMSRFVRVVDRARRHELIIFYTERISDAGYTLAQIAKDGDVLPAFRHVADSLTARSLRAFNALPADGPASCAP